MKIKVEPLLPTGNYLNVRIGIERDIPDDDNAMEAIFTEWDNIIAMHMKRYPHLYNEKGEPLYEGYKGEEPSPIQINEPPAVKLTKEEKQKAEIASCTDKTVLESYRLIVKKYPNLQATYDETMEKILKTA